MVIDLKDDYVSLLKEKINFKKYLYHQKEQIVFRSYLCKKECFENKKCLSCGCNFFDAISDILSCNYQRKFPNMMNDKEWTIFKTNHNIKFLNNELL